MTDLISRLESAPEGSRELSDEVLLAAGWERVKTSRGVIGIVSGWRSPDGEVLQAAPDPTRNVQDAIDWLVPEGRWWVVNSGVHAGASKALVDAGKAWEQHESNAATPPLAMSAACLKAREIEK